MSKEDIIIMEGVVELILPNTVFRVRLEENNSSVLGYLSGKMRTNNIKVLMGDRVEIHFSPYDLSKGRITRRK